MIKPGHIRLGIDRKVYFEYYELEKPNESYYFEGRHLLFRKDTLQGDMKEYEASKQLIEVSNVYYNPEANRAFIVFPHVSIKFTNNQPCKVEVTGNKATIIELN